jgi:hypothetical protein
MKFGTEPTPSLFSCDRKKEATMSDYRDPRDPLYRDPAYDALNDPALRDARSQAFSPGIAVAWFADIALFIAVMIFAFGGENQQVAGTDTSPPATQTQPANPPAAAPTTPAPAPAPQTPAKQ